MYPASPAVAYSSLAPAVAAAGDGEPLAPSIASLVPVAECGHDLLSTTLHSVVAVILVSRTLP